MLHMAPATVAESVRKYVPTLKRGMAFTPLEFARDGLSSNRAFPKTLAADGAILHLSKRDYELADMAFALA